MIDDFIMKKHDLFRTPEKMIFEWVNLATGETSIEREKIINGEINEVYRVTTSQSNQYIVRISRNSWNSFKSEEWVKNECLKINLPVSPSLLVGNANYGNMELEFEVQEAVVGEELHLYKNGLIYHNSDFKKKILAKAGNILSKIHSIHPGFFGRFDSLNTSLKTQYDYFMSKWPEYSKYTNVLIQAGFDKDQAEKIVYSLPDLFLMYNDDLASVVHGDYSLKHLLVSEEEIVGVIDFGNTKSGSPYEDLVYWQFFPGDELPLELLLTGYENQKLIQEPNFKLKMHLYSLYRSIEILNYFQKDNRIEGVNKFREQIKTDAKALGII